MKPNKNQIKGMCLCGNISYKAVLQSFPNELIPRCCTCDFCVKHKAKYLSDPEGLLEIFFNDSNLVNIHTQGSGLAKFILCGNCNALVGVYFESENSIYASVNLNLCADYPVFGEAVSVTPSALSVSEKSLRWKRLWFKDVKLNA